MTIWPCSVAIGVLKECVGSMAADRYVPPLTADKKFANPLWRTAYAGNILVYWKTTLTAARAR